MNFNCICVAIFLAASLAIVSASIAQEGKYVHIQVVDQQTGRGVPLIELGTVNNIRHVTDSAGNIAFFEPGLMDQDVFFHVAGHGYEYPKDGFAFRGLRIKTTPGTKATVKVQRINLAERLYRITGGGIYRDTVLLDLEPPIEQPLVNGKVIGCDSVVNAHYHDRLYWFWGDTNRPAYPLGNFQVTGATSDPPGQIDPAAGINLKYFVDEKGFAKQMAPVPGKGPNWIFGTMVLQDKDNRERMLAKYEKIKAPMTAYERGLVLFNDEKQQFEKLVEFDLEAPLYPDGQCFVSTDDNGDDYLYFATPFPLVRVQAKFDTVQSPKNYEAYTYFKSGVSIPKNDKAEFQFGAGQLNRDAGGKLVLRWQKNTHPISPKLESVLIQKRLIEPNEAYTLVRDVETGDQIQLSSGSVAWNDYRKKWIMIAVQVFGSSLLGEIWYSESDLPEGPWLTARKIVTHDDYSFYNPRHHPGFDQEGGRVIYFEGTYTQTFSGAKYATPRYDYNQIMYRLDLGTMKLDDED